MSSYTAAMAMVAGQVRGSAAEPISAEPEAEPARDTSGDWERILTRALTQAHLRGFVGVLGTFLKHMKHRGTLTDRGANRRGVRG